MISVKIDQPHPPFFGYTGLHLYAVRSTSTGSKKVIVIDANSAAIDLYKVYDDLAIFLGNSINYPIHGGDIRYFAILGNPDHHKYLVNENDGYTLVGYLDHEDVKKTRDFLLSNRFDEIEHVQRHYDNLSDEVKAHLEILLDDQVIEEVHAYLEMLVKFFDESSASGSEIIIIVNE
jgi:hypothetical protein